MWMWICIHNLALVSTDFILERRPENRATTIRRAAGPQRRRKVGQQHFAWHQAIEGQQEVDEQHAGQHVLEGHQKAVQQLTKGK